jgi:hypothetical protein
MVEREYCPRHQRYLSREDGSCIDCKREITEAQDEGAAQLAKELMRHLPGDILLKTLLKEMGFDV